MDARRDTAAKGARLAEGVVDGVGRVGGGTLPLYELPGPVVAVDHPDPGALAARLRAGDPAAGRRIEAGRLLMDPRTLTEAEVEAARQAVLRGCASPDS